MPVINIMWYFFAEDGTKGIGFGIPKYDYHTGRLNWDFIHQPTLGL